MLISVIVPVYNCEDSLHLTMDNLLKQSYSNIEIILVNDGSKDNSGLLCDEYAKLDSRVIVIHQENKGASSARNNGRKIAKGAYISFIDAGDIVETDLYESLLEYCSCKIDFIDYPYNVQNSNGDRYPVFNTIQKNTIFYVNFIEKEMFPCILNLRENTQNLPVCFAWRILFKKSIIDKYDVSFDERTRKWNDRDFIIEYLRYAKTVVFLDKPLYTYVCLGTGTNLAASYYPNVVFERIDKMEYREKIFKDEFDFNTEYYYNTNFSAIVDLLKTIVQNEEEPTAKKYIEKVLKNCFVISLAQRATGLDKKLFAFKKHIIDCDINAAYVLLHKPEKFKKDYKGIIKEKIKRIIKKH